MLPPVPNNDGSAEYEITRYEMSVRRCVRRGDIAPVRVAPGEPGLNWVTGWVRDQFHCSPDEAAEIVGTIGAAWLDAHGEMIEKSTSLLVDTGEQSKEDPRGA